MPEAVVDIAVERRAASPTTERRTTGSFPTQRARRRYVIVLAVLILVCIASTVGVMTYDNPMPFGSDGFWRIVDLRADALRVIAIVAFCQALATVSFQTVTGNRILTPGIMGFEALYVAVQTASVFHWGTEGINKITGTTQFLALAVVMVIASTLLYTTLLSGRFGDMHTMLLVGVIIGGGLASLTAFMQRVLTPSEFDVLAARLFGSIAAADDDYLNWALPISLLAGFALILRSKRLNVLGLGSHAAANLGLHPKRETMIVLFFVSVLMAMSTAMVGPMVFLGFLVAMLTYQLADTHDHRYLLPMSALVGYATLSSSYFVLRHVFYAEGRVTIIIELVGGLAFLVHVMRKGRL